MREIHLTFKCLLVALLVYLAKDWFLGCWKDNLLPFLNRYIAQSMFSDFLFLSFFCLGVWTFLEKDFRSPFGPMLRSVLSLSFVVLVLIRIYRSEYFGPHFLFLHPIYYLDVFLFILLVFLIKSLKTKKTKIWISHKSGFRDFTPVNHVKDDSLGYSTYAKSVSRLIGYSQFDQAFSVGITGRWGSGKTSFSNLLENEIRQSNDAIIIKFKPWVNSDSKGIVVDFFSAIDESLNGITVDISTEISGYLGLLIKDESNIQVLKEALNNDKRSIDSEYKRLCEEFLKLNKRVFVFIDDIDRLEANEILNVLRLIRNTANFPNFCYVVNYDRVYVMNSLKGLGVNDPGLYLEKIFPLEVNLPSFKKEIIRKEFVDGLANYFNLKEGYIRTELGANNNFGPDYLDKMLLNMRDVNRLLNGLFLNTESIFDEVYIHDLILVEILRMKFPEVYELLSSNRYSLIGERQEGNKNVFVWNPADMQQKTVYADLKSLGCYSSDSLGRINHLMNELFGGNKFESLKLDQYSCNSIIFPSKYERYFSYKIEGDEFSIYKFSVARSGSYNDLDKYIWRALKHGQSEIIKDFIFALNSFDDLVDVNRILKALFVVFDWEYETNKEGLNVDYYLNYLSRFQINSDARRVNEEVDISDDLELNSEYVGESKIERIIFFQLYLRRSILLEERANLLFKFKDYLYSSIITSTAQFQQLALEFISSLQSLNSSNCDLVYEIVNGLYHGETSWFDPADGVTSIKLLRNEDLRKCYLNLLADSDDYCILNSLFDISRPSKVNSLVDSDFSNVVLRGYFEFVLFSGLDDLRNWLGSIRTSFNEELVNDIIGYLNKYQEKSSSYISTNYLPFNKYVNDWVENSIGKFVTIKL